MYTKIDIRNKRDSAGARVECEASYEGPLGSFRERASNVTTGNPNNYAVPADLTSEVAERLGYAVVRQRSRDV